MPFWFTDQLSGPDRIPGSMIVVCSQPPQPSTTTQVTTKTTSTTTHHQHTTNDVITSSTESIISTENENKFTTSKSTSVVNITNTVLSTNSEVELTTVSNLTESAETGEIQNKENRDLAHFPCMSVKVFKIQSTYLFALLSATFDLKYTTNHFLPLPRSLFYTFVLLCRGDNHTSQHHHIYRHCGHHHHRQDQKTVSIKLIR
jgi:hypothetical protein